MARKKLLCRLSDGTTAWLSMKSARDIIKAKGLDPSGAVQVFHTQNVLRRIKKYMPARPGSGETYKLTVMQTDIREPKIITQAPHAEYIFLGEKMVDPRNNAAGFMTPEGWRSRKGCVKVRTGQKLEYCDKKNPRAGARWDKAVSVNEGAEMAQDLQRYIHYLSRKK